MAQSYYKIAGTTNPTTDWRTSADLEADANGNVTRRISTTEAVQLSTEERTRLEESGLVLEQVSADEAKTMAEQQPVVGTDVAGTSPVINQPSAAETDQGATGKTK